MRLQHPSLAISTLVRHLKESGVLQPGTFSLSSVYRLLAREGLDRPRLIAEGSGPTKAFKTELANALWMADVMEMVPPCGSGVESRTRSFLPCSTIAPA